MKSYLRDSERFYVMKKDESDPHIDSVSMVIHVIEHGKGGRVETTSVIPFGVTRSVIKKETYDSLDELRELMDTPGTEFNSGTGEISCNVSKQGVLEWADRFNHFDIEKMFS